MTAQNAAQQDAPQQISQIATTEVLIIGAGFGGLEVARHLGKAGIDVTVVDRCNYHLFQPLLYQVATASLSSTDVAEPIRKIMRGLQSVKVHFGEVDRIDTPKDAEAYGEVRMTDDHRIRFKHLVLATGASHSYFGNDDWAQWAPGLKSIEDAQNIRSKLLLTFERAESAPDAAARERLLRIAIVGGGPTGVEMAGAIAELSRYTLARDFRNINPETTRISLLEAGPRLLGGFSEEASAYAATRLERLGVDVRLDAAVDDIGPDTICVAGQTEPVGLVIWAAGVAASPLAAQLGETDDAGRIAVDSTLAVVGKPRVYALGDVAAFTDANGDLLPGLAQVARQQGIHLGRGLAKLIASGTPLAPFAYNSRGNTAIVGRNIAVFEYGKFKIKGWFAWLGWAVIHIYLLVGFQNSFLVSMRWLWRYVTFDRGARLIAGARIPSEKAFAAGSDGHDGDAG